MEGAAYLPQMIKGSQRPTPREGTQMLKTTKKHSTSTHYAVPGGCVTGIRRDRLDGTVAMVEKQDRG
jgi:hypothetical protein